MLQKLGVLLLLGTIVSIFCHSVDAQDFDTQLIYSFEDGVEGWEVVTDWAAGLSVEQSTAMGNCSAGV
jgi:hypothetical protein